MVFICIYHGVSISAPAFKRNGQGGSVQKVLTKLGFATRLLGMSILMLIFGAIAADTGINGYLATVLLLAGFVLAAISGFHVFYYLEEL